MKGIPKAETSFVRYHNTDGVCLYVITSNTSRDTYYLYKIENEKAEKISKSKSPKELETKYKICEEILTRAK